jgi:hypothetical protein
LKVSEYKRFFKKYHAQTGGYTSKKLPDLRQAIHMAKEVGTDVG